MNKKSLYSSIMIIALIAMSYNMVFTYSSGAPSGRTGGTGESTCNSVGCHAGTSVTTGGTIAFGSGDTSYTTGTKYSITVTGEGGTKNGFEIIAMNSSGTAVGTVTITDVTNTQTATGSSDHVTHTFSGTSNNTWSYDWTAPSSDEGDITFYAAVNKADGTGTAAGDVIFTNSLTVKAPPTGIGSQSVQASNDNKLKVYPNPAYNNFNIEFNSINNEIATISMYNSRGQEVKKLYSGIISKDTFKENYNISSHIKPGIYFIQVRTQNNVVANQRLILLK